jgi:class 3 adenylate cyclase/tetratricopeptide (TPR) repeat protein
MRCPSCAQDNETGANFCEACAAPLPRTCGRCGHALSPSAKFCPACAHPVSSFLPGGTAPSRAFEDFLTSAAAREGERKQVTVLFADMAASMQLLADRDPEEARKLLSPVIERMTEAVHRFEGVVNQVMGDGIMALFGAPVAQEDHAVRACHAALGMQESIARWAEDARHEHGVTVRIRVGLNSGEAVVASMGSDLRMDYTAVGQTTHLAARMEQMASPGSILITPATMQLVLGQVTLQTLGFKAVKGLDAPIEIYEVLGPGTVRTALEAGAARRLTRFVGREAEFAQLERALASTRRGRGQVISVVGEPGVGKSRLFYELTRSSAAADYLVLHAGAVSYWRTTAYRPIIDLLRSYFRVHAVEGAGVREAVRGGLAALGPDLLSLLPALMALLQPGDVDPGWAALDPRERRQRTRDSVRRLIVRESETRPVCLVLEDLHWIDSETRAVIEGLIEILPATRLLLLLNYRPEFRHDWGTRIAFTQLRIEPLGPESARTVLDTLLGDRKELDPLKALLIERTDGNPFFLEESVRTLVENRTLVGGPGDYQLARPVRTLDMPSTVQAVLGARIDRLAPAEKRLLQCASVIGERVPTALLQAVADAAPDEVWRGLEALQAGEFLHRRLMVPEPEYVFTHGLTRRVAYASMLQARRRALHARVVQHLETHQGDRILEHVETLADHAWHGELWDRAARYLRQAGAKAFAHSANREAVASFEQALEAARHLPETAETRAEAVDVHLGLRNALTLLGEHERTLEHLHQAEGLAEGLGDLPRLGRALSFEANALLLLGRHAKAIEAGGRARDVADRLGDAPLRTATELYLGRAQLFLGRFPQAIEILEGVVARLTGEQAGDHLGLPILPAVFARSHLVECLVELGRFADSERYATEGIALAEARNHLDTLLWAYHGAGVHHLALGNAAAATAAFERAYGLCRAHDMPAYGPRISAELALARALGGGAGEAVAMAQRAAEEARARRQVWSYSQVLLLLGEVCLLAGRLTEAQEAARLALERFRRQGEQAHEAWALRLLGDIAAQDNSSEAAGLYHTARQIAVALGMAPLVARCEQALNGLAGDQTAEVRPA